MLKANLIEYFDSVKQESRYRLFWDCSKQVLIDTAAPAELAMFILGLTSSGPIEIQTVRSHKINCNPVMSDI